MRLPIDQQIQTAQRLAFLMQRIGFAIWQLQSLEHGLASYLVVRVKATKGIGEKRGNELMNHALKQTLGTTIKELKSANVIESCTADALTSILEDRNWLVHRARGENRGVVFNSERTEKLLSRVEEITSRCESLIKLISEESREYVVSQGVDQKEADKLAIQIARNWELPV